MNLYNSKVFGINLKEEVLQATSSFLSCEIGIFHFPFLEIPIGVNPRWKETRNMIIAKVRKILPSWKGNCFPQGGRISEHAS